MRPLRSCPEGCSVDLPRLCGTSLWMAFHFPHCRDSFCPPMTLSLCDFGGYRIPDTYHHRQSLRASLRLSGLNGLPLGSVPRFRRPIVTDLQHLRPVLFSLLSPNSTFKASASI